MALLDHHAQSRKPIPWAAAGMVCLALATVLSVPAQSNDQPRAQPQYTIRARAPLTTVDVVVTDAKSPSPKTEPPAPPEPAAVISLFPPFTGYSTPDSHPESSTPTIE